MNKPPFKKGDEVRIIEERAQYIEGNYKKKIMMSFINKVNRQTLYNDRSYNVKVCFDKLHKDFTYVTCKPSELVKKGKILKLKQTLMEKSKK